MANEPPIYHMEFRLHGAVYSWQLASRFVRYTLHSCSP